MTGVLNLVGLGNNVLTVQVDPAYVNGYRTGRGTAETSGASLCTAFNGAPPYTYSWVYVSGDASIYAYSPSSPSTVFAAYFFDPDTFSAVWKCTVTDSVGTIVSTSNVSIDLTRFY